MPSFRLKRNNINPDIDSTVLAQGEPFFNYWEGDNLFFIGDGVTPIKDLPRYVPDAFFNHEKLTQAEYDNLPVKTKGKYYFVE